MNENSNNGIKTIDLFCGCGGLSLGLAMAGYDIRLGTDNDPIALETFLKNHNGVSILESDIGNVTGKKILKKTGCQEIDLIVGGPPCQGLSLSGPRKFHDPRNRLFLSFVRIADEIKPKAFILENVPGLLGLFKGKMKEAIKTEFENIGYNISIQALNAADYGVPQSRKRVFFVGLKKSGKKFIFPLPSFFEKEGLFCSKYISCKDALSDLPPLTDDLGSEKQKYPSPPKNEYQKLMRNNAIFINNHIATNHTEHVRKIIDLVPEGGNYKDLPEEYKKTRNFHVAWSRYDGEKPAPTIDTGHRHHFHYEYNRVPTVRENARLQSFPDTFKFYGNKTQQNKHVGNAVPPLLAKAIGEELKKCL